MEMTKITITTIEEILGWKSRETFPQYEHLNVQYKSQDGRFILSYTDYVNMFDESGFGWNLHVDNSDFETLANCCVEYIEQVNQIMELYKEY